MKNIIRVFALALVATGAVASLHASAATTSSPVAGKFSAPPIPMCAPNDPDACGMAQMGK